MEVVYRVALFITGIINLLPAIGAFIPEKISKAYGITVPDANYELILRHRAILFGFIGGLLIFSAITKKYYGIATFAGLFSMATFILLYFSMGKGINQELRKIMLIDVFALLLLLVAAVLYFTFSKKVIFKP